MTQDWAKEIQELCRQRKFDEAMSRCTQWLEKTQNNSADRKAALQLTGTIYYLQGQLAKAIMVFQKLLELDPKHTDAAISLSIILNDVGKYDDAKKVYQVANQSLQFKRVGYDSFLDRKFSLKHIEMGDLYFKYHRYDEAIEDYSRALRLDPQALEIRIKLAKAYAKKGYTTRAIQELQQLCHENKDYVAARIQLGLMYYSQGNVIDAQVEWERAQSQDANNPEVKSYLEMAKQAAETTV